MAKGEVLHVTLERSEGSRVGRCIGGWRARQPGDSSLRSRMTVKGALERQERALWNDMVGTRGGSGSGKTTTSRRRLPGKSSAEPVRSYIRLSGGSRNPWWGECDGGRPRRAGPWEGAAPHPMPNHGYRIGVRQDGGGVVAGWSGGLGGCADRAGDSSMRSRITMALLRPHEGMKLGRCGIAFGRPEVGMTA